MTSTTTATIPRRTLAFATAVALTIVILPWQATPAAAFPVASDAGAYAACGRVFPDPMAYWPSPEPAPGQSPWAKGNFPCRSVDFLGWDETLAGLAFLESEEMFGDFVEVYDLSEEDGEFSDILDIPGGEGLSAGLPTTDGGREKSPMIMVRVTDEQDTGVAITDREHFVYALSIHGIERAGVEGGIRAIEDLATWASCEKHGEEGTAANCAQEAAGPDNPHPILETLPEESVTAGDALRQSSVWFVLSNPDGWRRGDKQDGGFFYQRYNGNGMDLNRDWPATGFTYRPYTPWSEPENRATGRVLQDIRDRWTGGIDLHGQLIDRAFSFTLIGASERPYGKDRRVLQFVKGAWADAEDRLAWSATIKPNDAPEEDPRVYGVQWGTIWDTIAYTVTGALGDWMDSPLGLNADGIDNEMSLSHLSNCGIGTCFIPEAEQLHVDGNKSLIYAMIHYSLLPEDQTFRYEGRAAYLHNPRVIADPGQAATEAAQFDLPPQEGESTGQVGHPGGSSTYEFVVEGPNAGVYNGGLFAEFTFGNVQGTSGGTANEIAIDRRIPEGEEADPQRGEVEDGWQTMNTYFNQSVIYAQGGARIDVNGPPPGEYRLRVTGDAPTTWSADISFTGEASWPDPGQLPFEATNMDYFEMLQEFVPDAAERLVPVTVADVLSGEVDLAAFDTVVAADDAFLPGYLDPEEVPRDEAQETIVDTVTIPAPAAGERTPASTVDYPFEVEAGNGSLGALVDYAGGDVDIFLQKQRADGEWSGDLAQGTSFNLSQESLSYAFPQSGSYRLQIVNYAAPPQPGDVTITFYNAEGESGPGSDEDFAVPLDTSPDDNIDSRVTRHTQADRDRMAAVTRDFAEQGGNLVLTDDSLRALEWMGLVPDGAVRKQAVYAGHVQFEYTDAEGETVVTYDDPLAANVDQPGAAEGPNHRHQVTEPVPIGFAIQDLSGNDFSASPQWAVDRAGWDESGGRIVGTVGAGDVTLGEIPVGDGVVRVLGTLVPFPTDTYDHPFGVESYAVTYTGYELTRNLLDWTNPDGAAPVPPPAPPAQPAPPLPATGSGSGTVALVVLTALLGVVVARRSALRQR